MRSIRSSRVESVDRRGRGKVVSKLYVGDSKTGATGATVHYGTRELDLKRLMPAVGRCAGAYMVQPRGRGALIQGDPDGFPFATANLNLSAHRIVGAHTTGSTYSGHSAAPGPADGAQATPGETNTSDVADTCEFLIPQNADQWPSSGCGGYIPCENSGSSAVIRGGVIQIAALSEYTVPGRFAWMWDYVPNDGKGAGAVRNSMSTMQYLYMRRDIPQPGGANQYDTRQITMVTQKFNGEGDSITGGSNASADFTDSGNWTNFGSTLSEGTDYTFRSATVTGLTDCHGFATTTADGDYNDPATARGIAILGISSLYEGDQVGLRTGIMTRGGFKADSLNDTVHDGSATDPQRVLIAALAPDVVEFTLGANDAGASVAAADFADDIATAYDRISQYYTGLIHVRLDYVGDRADAVRALMASYGAEVADRCRTRARLCLTDTTRASLADPVSIFDSGPHLNTDDSGVDRMVRRNRRAMRRNGKRHGRHRHAA